MSNKVKVKALHHITHSGVDVPPGTEINVDEEVLEHLEAAGAVERVYANEDEKRNAQEKRLRENKPGEESGLKELPGKNSPPVREGNAAIKRNADEAKARAESGANRVVSDPNNDNNKTTPKPADAVSAGSDGLAMHATSVTSVAQEQELHTIRQQAERAARQNGKSVEESRRAGDAAVASARTSMKGPAA